MTPIRTTMAQVTEQHLSYHVLRYYHAADRSQSLPVRLQQLHGLTERLRGTDDVAASSRAELEALRASIADLASALAGRRSDQPTSTHTSSITPLN